MKKEKRRQFIGSISALAAVLILLSSCGSPAAQPSAGGQSTAPAAQTPADSEQEWVDLNIIGVAGNFTGFEKAMGTPVLKAIEDKVKVNLTVTAVDAERWNVILAGGDTTDIIYYQHNNYLSQLVAGELIIPLNDLLDTHGPDILANFPQRLENAASIIGEDNTNIYSIPYGAGPEGGNSKATNSVFLTRWDLYKEIGAPKVTSLDDYLQVLADMVAANPKTEDGLPVYGVSLYTEDNSFQYVNMHARALGYSQYNDWVSIRTDGTNAMKYAYLDEDSSFWVALDFLNKAYHMGMMDPDSFTQKLEDQLIKKTNWQVLAPVWRAHITEAQANELAANPESIKGYAVIPVEGSYIAENITAVFGGNFSASIAATCKLPDRAMQLLNYFNTKECTRLIFSGIEGEHWEVVDGVPQPMQTAIEKRAASGDIWFQTGVNNNALYGMVGLSRGMMLDDGAPADLYRSPSFFAKDVNTVDIDFSKYYGDYKYPNEVLKAFNVGDSSLVDQRISQGLGNAPDDIQRIDTRLREMAVRAVPSIIMGEDFEKEKEKAIQEFKANGADQSYKWWSERYAAIIAKYGK